MQELTIGSAAPAGRAPFGRRALRRLIDEFRHALPAMIFFLIGFNLIVLSMNLVLAQYLVPLMSFMVATLAALVVGKAVLVADKMPFLRRFDTAPLIRPILFKTFVYWVAVFIARLIEAFIHYLIDTGRVGGFIPFMIERFSWSRFAFVQLWIVVLFLIYVTASELNTLFGDGELFRILFTHRSTELKLTRRQRIRTMVAVSRLLDAHVEDELRDPNSAAHHRLIGMLVAMSRPRHLAGAHQRV